MKKWLLNVGAGIFSGLVTLIVIIFFVYIIVVFKNDPSLANAYVAIGTLLLAVVTSLLVFLTWVNIKNSSEREKREKDERLLHDIANWCADTLALCSKLKLTFNTNEERHAANGEYLNLKFTGENLQISANNEKYCKVLFDDLREALNCFTGLSKDDLQGHGDKRTTLEGKCKAIRENALELLKAI